MNKNKRASIWDNAIMIVFAAIGILIILGVIASFLIPGFNAFKLITEPFSKSYTAPVLENNTYFYSMSVGVNETGLANKGCTKTAINKYECPSGTELEFYVNISNTGNKYLEVYASPRIGYECNDKGKCKDQAYLGGQRRCDLDINRYVDCYVGFTFNFTERNSDYTIYPSSLMLLKDFQDLTQRTDVFNDVKSYNGNNVLFIHTKS